MSVFHRFRVHYFQTVQREQVVRAGKNACAFDCFCLCARSLSPQFFHFSYPLSPSPPSPSLLSSLLSFLLSPSFPLSSPSPPFHPAFLSAPFSPFPLTHPLPSPLPLSPLSSLPSPPIDPSSWSPPSERKRTIMSRKAQSF